MLPPVPSRPPGGGECVVNLPGGPLLAVDIKQLAQSGISAEVTEQARLRRVSSEEGAALVGRNGAGDFAGIAIPFIWPGEDVVREYRLRRDHPEMESTANGLKERNKYLS